MLNFKSWFLFNLKCANSNVSLPKYPFAQKIIFAINIFISVIIYENLNLKCAKRIHMYHFQNCHLPKKIIIAFNLFLLCY